MMKDKACKAILYFVATAFALIALVPCGCSQSSPTPDLEISLAPIHELRVNIAESYPPQIMVYIKGGLSDGCTTFHEMTTNVSGNVIIIEVTTQRPGGATCTQLYGFFERNVNLGSDFTSGEAYTVKANDKTTTFVMP